jgi:peptide chain release factor subunit 1
MQNLDQIIRDLSEIYDKQSLDSFITVYQNKNSDEKFIKRRENACFSLLESDEKQNFKDTIEQIKQFLNKNKNKNLAVFASSKHNFFKSVELPVDVYNALIVDSSPYIRPLARIQDEWESFTLVLLNSNFAKIYSICPKEIE